MIRIATFLPSYICRQCGTWFNPGKNCPTCGGQ